MVHPRDASSNAQATARQKSRHRFVVGAFLQLFGGIPQLPASQLMVNRRQMLLTRGEMSFGSLPDEFRRSATR